MSIPPRPPHGPSLTSQKEMRPAGMLGRENRPASGDAKGREGRARQRRSRARRLGCLVGGGVLKGVSQWAGHAALTVFPLLRVWSGTRNGPVLSGPGGLSTEAECDHGGSSHP